MSCIILVYRDSNSLSRLLHRTFLSKNLQTIVLFTDKKCPVLYKGICYVVLEADHIFVRQTAEEECEAKYGKDKGAHLADIVDKTLFKELVEYVEKLRYITDAFVLTGMEYYDQVSTS